MKTIFFAGTLILIVATLTGVTPAYAGPHDRHSSNSDDIDDEVEEAFSEAEDAFDEANDSIDAVSDDIDETMDNMDREADFKIDAPLEQTPRFYDDFRKDTVVGEYDSQAPDLDYVWMDAQVLPDGSRRDGFYRLRSRPNMRWMDGHLQAGRWVLGGWKTKRHYRHQVWVEGRRGPDGYWVRGHWRAKQRSGFRWNMGRLMGDRWIDGAWVPARGSAQNVGSLWVAGYTDPRGSWVQGFWRDARRSGFQWNEGRWEYGQWRAGHWQPIEQRAESEWSPGYYSGVNWVEGSWRATNRSGFAWVEGQRGRNGRWIRGHWVRSRVRASRRHRVYRVDDLNRSRRSQSRVWRDTSPTPRPRVRRRTRAGRNPVRAARKYDRAVRQNQRNQRRIQREARRRHRRDHL